MPPGSTRSYWWLQRPWWMRGAIAGLVLGAAMFVVSWASDDDPDLAGQLIVAAASAVLFATVLGPFIRSQERRGCQADGRTLSPGERIIVLRSVQAGRWPDDARLHPSARRLVDKRYASP